MGGAGPSGDKAYKHSTTQVPGMEGLLVDTGALRDLSGGDAVERMGTLALPHGCPTVWKHLAMPKHVSGVGDMAKVCTHQASVPGCPNDGLFILYHTPVSTGKPWPVPSLLGRKTMAKMNCSLGHAGGKATTSWGRCHASDRCPRGDRYGI